MKILTTDDVFQLAKHQKSKSLLVNKQIKKMLRNPVHFFIKRNT